MAELTHECGLRHKLLCHVAGLQNRKQILISSSSLDRNISVQVFLTDKQWSVQEILSSLFFLLKQKKKKKSHNM